MKQKKLVIALIAIPAIGIVFSQTVFQVKETQEAAVLRSGVVQYVVKKAGFHVKIPFLNHVNYYDKGWQQSQVAQLPLVSEDGKTVNLSYHAIWKIQDLSKFSASDDISTQLIQTISDSITRKLSALALNKIAGVNESEFLNDKVLQNRLADFGVELKSVALTRVSFSESARENVVDAMRETVIKDTDNIVTEAKEKAAKITSKNAYEANLILADATAKAEQIDADSERKTAQIYSNAYGKNIDFYKFFTTLHFYRSSLGKNGAVMIFGKDTPIMRMLLKQSLFRENDNPFSPLGGFQ